MASILPGQACVKSYSTFLVKLHRLAPPPFLLLLLLLLLSLLLALAVALLHVSLHTPFSNPHFLSPLLFEYGKHGFLSFLLHIQQHYFSFLLSPCPIFVLANFIIFTLLVKSFYLSSSPSNSYHIPDFSHVPSDKLQYDDACLPEHVLPSHEDFFLPFPPHQQYVLSHDPLEEYHVLSFRASEESTYFTNVQSYNKLNNKWETGRVLTMGPNYMSSNIMSGAASQHEEAKRPLKVMMTDKVQTTPLVAATAHNMLSVEQRSTAAAQTMPLVAAAPAPSPAYKMLSVEQGKVELVKAEALQEGRLDGKVSRSVKATPHASLGNQVVVINMEPPLARHTPISTTASHPPPAPAPLAPQQQRAKAVPPPLNTSTTMVQRPHSSPKVKKNLQGSGEFVITGNGGRHEVSKGLLAGEKQAAKLSKSQKKLNDEGRSYWDLPLRPEVITALTSSSSTSTNRPHMQRAQSLRGGSTGDAVTSSTSSTNTPHMQRAQSLRSNASPDVIASPSQVTRSPSFSELLDGLSDADANKCFSDYIAHRFALMKKELDVYSCT